MANNKKYPLEAEKLIIQDLTLSYTLRDFGDKLRDKVASGVILLGAKAGDKAMLLCMVTKDLTGRFSAGNIIKEIAPLIGGSGGGRPDMAQAGGTKPENLAQAISALEKIVMK